MSNIQRAIEAISAEIYERQQRVNKMARAQELAPDNDRLVEIEHERDEIGFLRDMRLTLETL